MNDHENRPQDTDALLLDQLRALWEHADPVPPELSQRSLVAIGMDDLDLELLLLQETAEDLAGARGMQTARTVTFTGEEVSVMVTITPSRRNHFRLDGWVAPLGGGRVHVRHSEGHDVDGDVDREGRFVLPDVRAGLAQIIYHPDDMLAMDALDHQDADAGAGRRPLRAVAAPPVRL